MMSAEAFAGVVLGTCTLQKLIGQGGMGVVFLAQQSRPHRQVAVKVFLPMHLVPPDQQSALLKRFQRETDVVAALEHPHIIPIYEYGEHDGLAYLVMPYIQSGTLCDMMERGGPLPLEKAALYLEQIAAALAYAHMHGIIHRDIKPENILMRSEDHLLLSDFGLVKIASGEENNNTRLTSNGLPLGTFAYIAPEQVVDDNVDTYADQYALAVLLYQMVTGTVPFKGATSVQVVMHHLHTPPPAPRLLRPDLPPAAEQVILKALAKQPTQRYAHVWEFAMAFRLALTQPRDALEISHATTGNPGITIRLAGLHRSADPASSRPDRADATHGQDTLAHRSSVARLASSPPTQKVHKHDIVGRTSITLPSLSGFLPLAPDPQSVNTTPETTTQTASARQAGSSSMSNTQEAPLSFPGGQAGLQAMTSTKGRRSWLRPFTSIAVFAILLVNILAYVYMNVAPQNKGFATASATVANTGHSLDTTPGVKNFRVGADPAVMIQGRNSNVIIHAGTNGMVTVKAALRGKADGGAALPGPLMQSTQTRNGQGHDFISITTALQYKSVDYDLTVPATTTIHIKMTSGSMAVEGVSGVTVDTDGGNISIKDVQGPLNLHTVNGDITVNTVKGQMTIEAGSGSIRINDVTGELKAITNNGDVIVRGAVLSGQSMLKTNNGSVRLEGSVDPKGNYALTTYRGNINLLLPGNTSFQLNTHIGSGSFYNEFGSNNVGMIPRAQIIMSVGYGSIAVNKAA